MAQHLLSEILLISSQPNLILWDYYGDACWRSSLQYNPEANLGHAGVPFGGDREGDNPLPQLVFLKEYHYACTAQWVFAVGNSGYIHLSRFICTVSNTKGKNSLLIDLWWEWVANGAPFTYVGNVSVCIVGWAGNGWPFLPSEALEDTVRTILESAQAPRASFQEIWGASARQTTAEIGTPHPHPLCSGREPEYYYPNGAIIVRHLKE